MPFGDSAAVLNGFIVDSNGNTLMNISNFSEMETLETDNNYNNDQICTTYISEPVTFTFKPIVPGKVKRFYAKLIGWKARGPFRKRLLNKLIFRRK